MFVIGNLLKLLQAIAIAVYIGVNGNDIDRVASLKENRYPLDRLLYRCSLVPIHPDRKGDELNMDRPQSIIILNRSSFSNGCSQDYSDDRMGGSAPDLLPSEREPHVSAIDRLI
jgi:hypothetical protein